MDLIVDIGNSRIKWAFFENDMIIEHGVVLKAFFLPEIKAQSTFNEISRIGVCSVNKIPEELLKFFSSVTTIFYVNSDSMLTFKSNYKSMTSLGADRLALVAAAQQEYPDDNCLIIDLGTCITYELKDAKGIYHGGVISPGCTSRYRAMHNDTHGLPQLQAKNLDIVVGETTEECMHIGVIKGVHQELRGFISHFSGIYKDLTVILTGGDAHFFEKKLKNSIFAHSNFLLKGIHSLLKENLN
ncbi:MAG: pantothenate kinase [Flavobacteriaceae bacterium]|nr:pantothenate kinase [Flavobacteriaceae bacterium]